MSKLQFHSPAFAALVAAYIESEGWTAVWYTGGRYVTVLSDATPECIKAAVSFAGGV